MVLCCRGSVPSTADTTRKRNCETAQDNETPHHQNTKQESRAVAGNYRAMRDT